MMDTMMDVSYMKYYSTVRPAGRCNV